MKKTILLTLGFLGLLAVPAMAQLGRVWTDFQAYSTDLQNYLTYENLSETLNPLETTTSQSELNNSQGDLNIPNPIAAGEQARRNISILNYTIPDKFENNEAIRANAVTNEINRYITRSSVQGMLGREGQTRLRNKLETTQTIVESIDETIEAARQSSKNILDQISQLINQNNPQIQATQLLGQSQSQLQLQTLEIQSQQAKISTENLAQTIQTNQSLQYSNLNLANISQQMEEANRSRRVDTSTEAARLLRNTAQVDLFGRKIEN